MFDHIPVGVGSKGVIPMNSNDLEEALGFFSKLFNFNSKIIQINLFEFKRNGYGLVFKVLLHFYYE